MRNITKLLIVAGGAIGLTGAALIATGQAQTGPAKPLAGHTAGGFNQAHSRGYRTPGHGYRRGRAGQRLIENFDTDKDGKLTQSEVDKARVGRLAKFDTDKDGRLSLKEYEALWLDAMRERMVDRFQHLDADGDGRVTAEEFAKPLASVVARLDRDDDGSLTRKDFRR